MAMRVMRLLLAATFVMIAVASWGTHGSASDEASSLLAFKAELAGSSSSGVLASWNASTGVCRWEGVACSGGGGQVVSLSLPSYGLAGALSPAIGNLTFLRTLNLSSNWFQGEIPESIGRLARLQALDLSYNALSGTLPASLSSCVSLLLLSLSSNQIHGRIPVELGNKLTYLRGLLLANNSLTGAIPGSLGNLSSLDYLDLTDNQLEGPVPHELGSIGGLQTLFLFGNSLSGVLPQSLYNLSSLKNFGVEFNMLSGTIPADIGDRFPGIETLSFSYNRFSGAIPPSVSNLSALIKLGLAGNGFIGHVPPALGKLQGLTVLDLGDNRLQANDSQGISGAIPSDIGNLVGLKLLEMANNSISGAIPESIGRLENLVELGLYNTSLSGLIPPSLGNLTQLNRLYAYYGNLEGPIPRSLGNLKNVFVFDLSTNRLNGSIPKEVLKLPQLSWYLDLSYNALSGPLPVEVGSLANLNQLILSGNQLSSSIPDSIGNCISLEQLLLDHNSFEGTIPQSLKNLKGLALLNLTMNKLSGSIPDALASIGNLQQLYLAHNNLSGLIPAVLQNLTLLSKLDLSFNDLQGEVPKGGVFANATSLSIHGNDEICGGAPQLHLAPCSMAAVEKNKRQVSRSLMVTLTSLGALVFLAVVVTFIHLIHKRFRQRKASQLISTVIDEQYERVSYQALSNGTGGFSEANLLGQGSYGAVYRCNLHDQGITTAVKVFNIRQSWSNRSFVAECEALRRVRHRCLIKIITCCSSINYQGEEFKALVFEFMPNGSLNDWLHPVSKVHTLSNTLSLAQRLDIAVDIMDALEYLHNQCQPPVIHCDLKPSNILLAEDMKYGEGRSVSTLGDVYSLGILLLEMFTGRSPTDDMFKDLLDLHRFAEAAPPNGASEIADPAIWLHEEAKAKDPADAATMRSRSEECLVSAIRLGVSCSKQQPRERMAMRDAAVEMRAIRDAYLMVAS
uniref:non-specific serine/threonine protein kinase n=1 Tax=Saccharum hybrid cultivar R570 TaxID=131158 RepID=A0A059Q2I3_9POAL|nr:LRR-kinase protein [Saccharum hybrid cultivar R570]